MRDIARFDAEIGGALTVDDDADFRAAELERAVGVAEVVILLDAFDQLVRVLV